jgi:hypothetical protein
MTKTARDIGIHFQLQNALLFPGIHKTLEINNNIKEGGAILFLIKEKWIMETQNALNY